MGTEDITPTTHKNVIVFPLGVAPGNVVTTQPVTASGGPPAQVNVHIPRAVNDVARPVIGQSRWLNEEDKEFFCSALTHGIVAIGVAAPLGFGAGMVAKALGATWATTKGAIAIAMGTSATPFVRSFMRTGCRYAAS
ncbi:MAG: hypothetical protein OXF02_01185 [Simkaniaceae bacterium]|nr:hypothetical protein [Simkaniaceae bacterium]